MPRGRPPLPLTKEEALNARRDQVRKNVQAFRQRKSKQQDSNENSAGKPEELTLLLDNTPHCPDKHRSLDAKTSQHQYNKPWRDIDRMSGLPDYYLPFLLPQEINAAQMSLQQFAANAPKAFMPSGSSSEIGPHWSQVMPLSVGTNPILDLSIQALCLLQISNVSGEHHLTHSSMSFYSRALGDLQKAIAKPRPDFSIEIFSAAMALSAYELLQNSSNEQGRGWIFHVEGATSYLNLFPSLSLDTSSYTHQVSFHFLETVCIFDALGARRPSSFSTSKWWRTSVDHVADEVYGALLRIVTTLPSVLEQCDKASELASDNDAMRTWQNVVHLCIRFEAAFTAWFERTRRQLPPFQLVDTVLTYGVDSHTDVEFPNLYIARLYLLYWSSLIPLFSSIATLQSKMASSTPQSNAITFSGLQGSQPYTSQAHTFAINVRHSVHYCLQPRHGIVGKSLLLLPLWIARNFLRDTSDVEAKAFCDGVLEGMGQRNLSFGLKVR